MTSEILKVKKRFGYPPDLEETPLVIFFNLRNSKLLVFGWKLSKCWPGTQKGKKSWLLSYGKRQFVNCIKFNVGFGTKMLLKKKWGFSFLQKIKTHYQILEKIKKQSLVKLWKLRHNG